MQSSLSELGISRRSFLAAPLAAAVGGSLLSAAEQERPRDVSWLGEVQRPPQPSAGNAQRLRPLLVDEQGVAITTLSAWRKQREVIRGKWIEFLGSLKIKRSSPPKLKILSEDRPGDDVIRQLVQYEIEPGLLTEAYLLKPASVKGTRPGVIVHHSTVNHSIRQPAGVEGRPEKAFGLKLAQRGFVALCPRNFLWPNNHKISAGPEAEKHLARHPGTKGMAKMLFNSVAAVDILSGLPEVDPARLGVVGHSLGAKEALYLSAFDQRIKAAVSSEGGVGVKFSNWDAAWYLGPAAHGKDFRRAHHELLALAAPRPFLLIGGDSADGDHSWPFIEAALEVYQLYGGPPRIGLFNHKQGHSVPPKAERRIYQWLEAYL